MFEWLSLFMIALVGAMSPGPDFLVVSQIALSSGRRSGIVCSLGVWFGVVCHLLLLIFLSQWLGQFINYIKYAGVIFLLYLLVVQIMNLMKKRVKKKNEEVLKIGSLKSFFRGFLVNVLNPKALIFFVSFIPVLLIEQNKNSLAVLTTFSLPVFLWFAALSCFLSMNNFRKFYQRNIQYFEWTMVIALSLLIFIIVNG